MPVVTKIQDGNFKVYSREDFETFVCACGDPDCRGTMISMQPPCREDFEAVYSVPDGVLFLICCCGKQHTKAFRIGWNLQ